jgi:hypothetical protein
MSRSPGFRSVSGGSGMGFRFAGVALACALLGPLPARAEWAVVANEQQVEVSQQPVDGRGMPMFRAVGEVAGTPDQILAVLEDVDSHPKWMPDCAESRVVREKDEQVTVYRRSAAPWPVADRDVVVRSRTQVIQPGVEIHAFFEGVQDPDVPERSDTVRMPHLVGHWKIRSIAPDRSLVEYQVDADPGGTLPGWLAASASKGNPIRTIVGLRERVALARGTSAKPSGQ